MRKVIGLLCLLTGCAEEYYPNHYGTAAAVCTGSEYEPSDECKEVLRQDFGDEEGLITSALNALFIGVDPWFYNLAAERIDVVEYQWLRSSSTDAEAHYDDKSRTLTIYVLEQFEGVRGASFVVHEAGHGRPEDRGHVPCPDGLVQCDDFLNGAVHSQLQFLDEALEIIEDDEELWEAREIAAERLLVSF